MATKRRAPAKKDILESGTIKRAEEIVNNDENIPPIVNDSLKALKSEIENLRTVNKAHDSKVTQSLNKPADKGHHPAVTGLSIGGAKEVLDYIYGMGFAIDAATLAHMSKVVLTNNCPLNECTLVLNQTLYPSYIVNIID